MLSRVPWTLSSSYTSTERLSFVRNAENELAPPLSPYAACSNTEPDCSNTELAARCLGPGELCTHIEFAHKGKLVAFITLDFSSCGCHDQYDYTSSAGRIMRRSVSIPGNS